MLSSIFKHRVSNSKEWMDSMNNDNNNNASEINYNSIKIFREIIFRCSGCDMIYHTKPQLNLHQNICEKIIHSCTFCDKSFTYKGALVQHMNVSHPGTCKTDCLHCGLSFKSENKLNNHMMKHTGIKA